jgi:hypothetical protein
MLRFLPERCLSALAHDRRSHQRPRSARRGRRPGREVRRWNAILDQGRVTQEVPHAAILEGHELIIQGEPVAPVGRPCLCDSWSKHGDHHGGHT